jgi:hypothetical protein
MRTNGPTKKLKLSLLSRRPSINTGHVLKQPVYASRIINLKLRMKAGYGSNQIGIMSRTAVNTYLTLASYTLWD